MPTTRQASPRDYTPASADVLIAVPDSRILLPETLFGMRDLPARTVCTV